MASYLDVISLEEAKVYLRIDDTLTEDDDNIERMIASALSFVEKWTEVFVFDRDLPYLLVDGSKRIYSYPINAVVSPAEVAIVEKTLYIYLSSGYETIEAVINVGFTDPADVPQELREVAFQIIDILYYKAGNNKPIAEQLNMLAIDMLNQNKRFLM
jgi:hypothetical protein